MVATISKSIFFAGVILLHIIRFPFAVRNKKNKISKSRKSYLEMIILFIMATGMVIVPFHYVFGSLLDFANYNSPVWTIWCGIMFLILSLWLFWRSHKDLGRNFSSTLVIRGEHTLITEGVYKYVRHPMYTAFLLFDIAAVFLLHNWFAGLSPIVTFTIFFIIRVVKEEQMMVEQFGEEYRNYMKKTGRLLPIFNSK